MDNLAHSEIFALTLVIGTYLTSLALYKKVHISLLHPLLTTIFVIIVVLEVLGIQYESFQQSSHLIHFMLGPSVFVGAIVETTFPFRYWICSREMSFRS